MKYYKHEITVVDESLEDNGHLLTVSHAVLDRLVVLHAKNYSVTAVKDSNRTRDNV